MSIFARARANLNLTPAERAVLRFLEGLGCTALVAAAPILADALGHQAVAWGDVLRAALAAAAVAVLMALAKYAKAHGDPPLAQVATDVAADVQAGKTPQQVAQDAARDALRAAADAATKAALPTTA